MKKYKTSYNDAWKYGADGYIAIAPNGRKVILEETKNYFYNHVGGNRPHVVYTVRSLSGRKLREICGVCDIEFREGIE